MMDVPADAPPAAPPSNPIPRRLEWSGRTDVGRVRKNNEDTYVGLQFDGREVHFLGKIGEGTTGQTDFAFAVGDGMGGAKSGEHASRIAVDTITKLLPRAFQQSASGLASGFGDVLEELFTRIHQELVHVGRCYEECRGMETTLSLCWFTPDWMYFGHVGDSRIYYLPAGGGIRQLSEDDTYVGWLFRQGKINEREARTHPRRNVLQKSLGGGNQFVSPQVGAVAYEPGDMFLVCSDGLTDGLDNANLEDFLRADEVRLDWSRAAIRLVDESLARSGRDNTTALAIRVTPM